MKIITPPHITDLDELLDVVLHPEKFTARLLALQEMRDSILAVLDTYATKDKADTYFGAAETRLADANRTLESALNLKEIQEEDHEIQVAHLVQEQEKWNAMQQSQAQELASRRQELEREAANVAAQQRQLAQENTEVQAMLASVMQQKEAVKKEMGKIDTAKKVLDTLN